MVDKKEEKKIEVPEKHHHFPKLMLVGGIILALIAVLSLLNLFSLPKITMDILLLIAGLWLVFTGFVKGVHKQRREALKKYI